MLYARLTRFIGPALLTFAAITFIWLSNNSVSVNNTTMATVYALCALALPIAVFVRTIEYLKLGPLEMSLREAQQAAEEARELTKLIAEIAIPLAHHTEGWASNAPSTIQTKDLVVDRVIEAADRLSVDIDPRVRNLHYVKTCDDYKNAVLSLFPENNQKIAIIERMQTGNVIPTSIDQVESPRDLRRIIEDLDFMDETASLWLDDYQHYYQNRSHRDVDRWQQRGWAA